MNENPLASGALTPPSEKVAQQAQPKAFMPKHIHRDSGDGDTKDNSAWVNSQSGCPGPTNSNSYYESASRTQKAISPSKVKNSGEKKYLKPAKLKVITDKEIKRMQS